MRISAPICEPKVLSRKKVACLLWVGEEILPEVKEVKYLDVSFMSGGKMESGRSTGGRVWCSQGCGRSVAMVLIYRSILVPTLTHGHELWVVTQRTRVVNLGTRLRVQAAEMRFLSKAAGLCPRDSVRSSAIREELGVQPLLLLTKRSRTRWSGHLVRIPPGRPTGVEAFRVRPNRRRVPPVGGPQEDPGHA